MIPTAISSSSTTRATPRNLCISSALNRAFLLSARSVFRSTISGDEPTGAPPAVPENRALSASRGFLARGAAPGHRCRRFAPLHKRVRASVDDRAPIAGKVRGRPARALVTANERRVGIGSNLRGRSGVALDRALRRVACGFAGVRKRTLRIAQRQMRFRHRQRRANAKERGFPERCSFARQRQTDPGSPPSACACASTSAQSAITLGFAAARAVSSAIVPSANAGSNSPHSVRATHSRPLVTAMPSA